MLAIRALGEAWEGVARGPRRKLHLGLGRGLVGSLQLQLDRLADPQGFHTGNTEAGRSSAGGLTGWIKDRRSQGDLDASLEKRHLGRGRFVKSWQPTGPRPGGLVRLKRSPADQPWLSRSSQAWPC